MSHSPSPQDPAEYPAGFPAGAAVGGSLAALFEAQAAAGPERVAVECGEETLTYQELDARANQIAAWLRAGGVRSGDCVAFLLPRSADVYAALLGVLKAGAAYVPLDPDYPGDRIGYILGDCSARALITVRGLVARAAGFAGATLVIDETRAALAALPAGPLPVEQAAGPGDLCYVIYTSGTTGRPKGVQIEHGSACQLVRSEAALFGPRPEDRIYQGFSIAFDASVEEVWLAFNSGAALIAATAEVVRSGPALAPWLARQRVTILSCVPTLLAMMEGEIPSLRLLILGGEACPPDLVRRWWRPGLRVVNTYGPTEATVVATAAECDPSRPVTIGKPLAGYTTAVVDEGLNAVAPGTAGELCIGGTGLARGYVGRPELTREKFVMLAISGAPPARYYRTGDLVRLNGEGDLEFLGRIDTQVKIRGFRVELSEIEAVLLEVPGIRAAVVTLREDVVGIASLAAFVVPAPGRALDSEVVRAALRERLPAYMVPGTIDPLEELPLLPSGKVDRKALPAPRTEAGAPRPAGRPARPGREHGILEVWAALFAPAAVSVTDDFFLDLGGHSLIAARMVSTLRARPEFGDLSMLDVYRHPTVEALSAELDRRSPVTAPGGAPARAAAADTADRPRIPFWRHFWCGTAQAAALLVVLAFTALQWLTPYLTYTIMVEEEYSFLEATLAAFASLILFYPLMLCIPILVKWAVIGRFRAGAYPLWGVYYFRWWLVRTIEAAVPVDYLTGTPWLNLYLRLMGARVGRNVFLDANTFGSYDLLSIGGDTSINVDCNLLGYRIEDGFLHLGHIRVGQGCFVGARATLREDTEMADGAALEDLSLLQRGRKIPEGETWRGSPAARCAAAPRPAAARPPGWALRAVYGLLLTLGLLLFPVLVSAALFPGIVVMNILNEMDPYYWYLGVAPMVGLSFVVLLALEIAAVKWLVVGRVKPGDHPIHSLYYVRKWFVGQTMDLSLDILGPLYASIYLAPWYRLLGARLGRGAEISTASFISPDLLSIGEESFIADSVSLGAPRVRDGVMTLGRTRIGRRSFIGNSALLPPGAVIGDRVLIGCLSAPPDDPAQAAREDTAWLGSPALFLPQRQATTAFGEETTFHPRLRLRLLRAAIEFVRVITPSTGFIILISLLFSAILVVRDELELWQTLLVFPLLYLACALVAAAVAILAKWLIVWRYRPGEHPLWTTLVWRNELLNALHEHLADPFLVAPLAGTPFVCWYFRLLGARIGRRVYMETTDLSEYDLAIIGDEAELNADCTVQTHLFEDRVMKMSTVEIGARCTVGAGSLVLYDTRMEPGSKLDDLSLLMKGETLPRGTAWGGVPARKVDGGDYGQRRLGIRAAGGATCAITPDRG